MQKFVIFNYTFGQAEFKNEIKKAYRKFFSQISVRMELCKTVWEAFFHIW